MSVEIRKAIEMPIAKVDKESRTIYGVVYKASKEFDDTGQPTDYEDTQGNWAKADEVKKACHSFNKKLQNTALFKGGVDKQHNEKAGYGIVVESYIAKTDERDINAEAGDWVAAIEVTDEGCWKEVLKGDVTGFSIGGKAQIIEVEKDDEDDDFFQ
jgi:hypothetical protein